MTFYQRPSSSKLKSESRHIPRPNQSMSIQMLSTRKRAGEGDRYRPGAQQRQVDTDDFFEFRFDAYLTCKDILMEEYYKILKSESESLLESVRTDSRLAAQSIGDKLHMTCISTGLSEADRSRLIDATISMLHAEALVIEISSSHASAHDMLVEAAENVYETCHKQFTDNRRGRGGDNKHIDKLAKAKSSELPIEMIKSVYKAMYEELVTTRGMLTDFWQCNPS